MMVRTQISLTSEQHERVKSRAAGLDISIAEYIRGLVDTDLEQRTAAKGDISAIFNLGDSGLSDGSSRIDEIVGDALWDEHLKETGQERRP